MTALPQTTEAKMATDDEDDDDDDDEDDDADDDDDDDDSGHAAPLGGPGKARRATCRRAAASRGAPAALPGPPLA